jgi:hypothetical protein
MYTFSATSGSNGSATIGTVPVGAYSICVVPAAGRILLDSCHWVIKAVGTYIAEGKTVEVPVVLQKGILIQISVVDPGALFRGIVVFLEFLTKIVFVQRVMEYTPIVHRSANSVPPAQRYVALLH